MDGGGGWARPREREMARIVRYVSPSVRAVLTNGHTGYVPRAPDFFLVEGPPTGCGEINFFELISLS